MTNWKPDERTVRACIKALPVLASEDYRNGKGHYGSEEAYVSALTDCHNALEALLLKPDPATVAILDFIRGVAKSQAFGGYLSSAVMLHGMASAIERGEHLRPTTSEQNDHETG